MVDDMTDIPFFSALEDPKVQYHPKPQNWLSQTCSVLYQTISRNKVMTLLGAGILAMGDLYAMTKLPPYVGLVLEAGVLLAGAQYFAYHFAQQRKEAYLQNIPKMLPPRQRHPLLKDRKSATFNHVFSFIKAKGHIWYALRESPKKRPNWQIFYFDNLQLTPEQFANTEMIADGENIMLRVPGATVDTIYYKKVIEEARLGDNHIISSLCEEPEAIDSWFTLPVLNLLKPGQWGKRLTIAKNAKWAMSHAGEYKHQVIDARHKSHSNLPITTVYEYNQVLMSLHDPFVEKNSTFKLSLPSRFQHGVHFEASASMFFASSYKNKSCQLWSMYLDYDSEGINPLLSFTFDVNNHHKRLLPINKVVSHRLPVGIGEIANLTVLQCGHRPHNIEIRVQSKNEPNCFYFKKWDDSEWQCYDLKTRSIQPRVKSYQAKDLNEASMHHSNIPLMIGNNKVRKASAQDFDANGTFCQVTFEIEGKLSYCLLRRHKNLVKSFLGMQSESWSLNPDPQHPSASLLSGSDSILVDVKCHGNELIIRSQDKRYDFNLKLHKQTNGSTLPQPLEYMRLTRQRSQQATTSNASLQKMAFRT